MKNREESGRPRNRRSPARLHGRSEAAVGNGVSQEGDPTLASRSEALEAELAALEAMMGEEGDPEGTDGLSSDEVDLGEQ